MTGLKQELSRLAGRLEYLYQNESTGQVLRLAGDKLWAYGYTPIARFRQRGETFQLDGTSYPYFAHQYNATWRNERAVEIPLALDFLALVGAGTVLELGNVLSYYLDSPVEGQMRTVVDKYERASGVINADIINYRSTALFGAFLSISTFEHIGWDEEPRTPQKVAHAIAAIKGLIRPGAPCLVTVPCGYNDYLDEMIRDDRMPFKKSYFLKRVDRANHWEECDTADALAGGYEARFPAANALYVGRDLR
jgi:hypothetical protein